MKNNIFIRTLNEWNNCNDEERLSFLQEFENQNAKLQKREARTIVISEKLTGENNLQLPLSYFSTDNPEYIFISPTDRFIPIEYLINITHEGLHALIYDFFHSKADLTVFAKVDKDKLFKDYKYSELICKVLEQMGKKAIYDLMSYEESLVYEEAGIYILYHIYSSCESIRDAIELFGHLQDTFNVIKNKNSIVENIKSNNFDYPAFCEKVVNYDKELTEKHALNVQTNKEIKEQQDKILTQAFYDNFKAYLDYHNCKQEEKEEKKNLFIDIYLNSAYNYSVNQNCPLQYEEEQN